MRITSSTPTKRSISNAVETPTTLQVEAEQNPVTSPPSLVSTGSKRIALETAHEKKVIFRERMETTTLSPEERASRSSKLTRKVNRAYNSAVWGSTATAGGGAGTGLSLWWEPLTNGSTQGVGVTLGVISGLLIGAGTLAVTAVSGQKVAKKGQARAKRRLNDAGLDPSVREVLQDFAATFEQGSPEDRAALGQLASEWLKSQSLQLTAKSKKALKEIAQAGSSNVDASQDVSRYATLFELRLLPETPGSYTLDPKELETFITAFRDSDPEIQAYAKPILFNIFFASQYKLDDSSALSLHELLANPSSPGQAVDEALRRTQWLTPESFTPQRGERFLRLLGLLTEATDAERLREGLRRRFFKDASSEVLPATQYRAFFDALHPTRSSSVTMLANHYVDLGRFAPNDATEHVLSLFAALDTQEQQTVRDALAQRIPKLADSVDTIDAAFDGVRRRQLLITLLDQMDPSYERADQETPEEGWL